MCWNSFYLGNGNIRDHLPVICVSRETSMAFYMRVAESILNFPRRGANFNMILKHLIWSHLLFSLGDNSEKKFPNKGFLFISCNLIKIIFMILGAKRAILTNFHKNRMCFGGSRFVFTSSHYRRFTNTKLSKWILTFQNW